MCTGIFERDVGIWGAKTKDSDPGVATTKQETEFFGVSMRRQKIGSEATKKEDGR